MSPRRSTRWRSRRAAAAGEVRFLGEVENRPATIERTIKKLAGRYDRLHVCFEAGPTGYGLYRQVRDLGHDCMVVAPALIPKRSGERVKTNRRDAVTLARLHRAGELTGVWVPDAVHEAVRDLVRAREAASGRSAPQAPAAALLPAAPRPDLRRRRPLDAGASALACPPELRASGAADRLPGRRSTRSRMPLSGCAAWKSSWRADRADLVDGAGRGSLSGDARRLLPGRGDLCRRDRRCAPLRHAATADGVPRPGSGGALDRRYGPARRA